MLSSHLTKQFIVARITRLGAQWKGVELRHGAMLRPRTSVKALCSGHSDPTVGAQHRAGLRGGSEQGAIKGSQNSAINGAVCGSELDSRLRMLGY